MIVLKLDVTKIDKALLFKGTKGTYLDCALHENRDGEDSFGNLGFVTQSVSKEARERGEKGPIIGNYKEVGKRQEKPPQRTAVPPSRKPPVDPDLDAGDEDDIPF